jgi:type I restriction enzyme S subunit
MTNYPTYKLGDICELLNGFAFKSSNYVQSGLRVIRITNVKKGYVIDEEPQFYPLETQEELKKYILKKGDLLISLTGNVGRVGILSEDLLPAALNQRVGCLRVKDKILVSLQYLFHLLNTNSFEKDCINSSKGIAQKNMSTEWLKEYEISLPPLATQHAIVSRIETLFAELDKAVQHLRTAQQQLKTYRQAVLKAAFEECDSYEKITNCFDVTGGLTKNSQREKFSIKMPYLRVANVYYNRLDLSEIKEIGVQESEIKDKLLKKEDLLFVEENGSKEQIGRVAVWDGSIENCLHQNHIIKGRPLGTMLSKFALYYFISDFGREQILKVASSTSGLYTLSTEKVRNLKVPSCSLTEQHRIVQEIESRLSQATASETYIENALQQAEALRQSILKKAFSGELV